MTPDAAADLVPRILARDRKAAARAISLIEDDAPATSAVLDALYPHTGRGYRVGVTGPPGAGKSTLTAALAAHLRARIRPHPDPLPGGEGETVGVIAIDPTSPFTGGALLGDRVRMGKVALDPGVFIRSMATRGSLGGIARTTTEACDVLDAFGKDWIFIETVGVGQSEVEVADAADTTVVVVSPEAGDGVQAMKAGLMEIADVFCVNKADRDGADRMVQAIVAMLELAPHGAETWIAPVVKTVATTGEGIPELAAACERHREHLRGRGLLDRKRRERVEGKIRLLVEEKLWTLFWKGEAYERELSRATDDVLAGRATPYAAAAAIFGRFRSRL